VDRLVSLKASWTESLALSDCMVGATSSQRISSRGGGSVREVVVVVSQPVTATAHRSWAAWVGCRRCSLQGGWVHCQQGFFLTQACDYRVRCTCFHCSTTHSTRALKHDSVCVPERVGAQSLLLAAGLFRSRSILTPPVGQHWLQGLRPGLREGCTQACQGPDCINCVACITCSRGHCSLAAHPLMHDMCRSSQVVFSTTGLHAALPCGGRVCFAQQPWVAMHTAACQGCV
jgi:hypothetical protein